jgi:hypothetical protein
MDSPGGNGLTWQWHTETREEAVYRRRTARSAERLAERPRRSFKHLRSVDLQHELERRKDLSYGAIMRRAIQQKQP